MSQEHRTLEQQEAAAVFAVKNLVNTYLNHFKSIATLDNLRKIYPYPYPLENINSFLEKLTVEPSGLAAGELVGEDHEYTDNVYVDACHELIEILKRVLSLYSLELKEINAHRIHQYGYVEHDKVKVIIDPSLGQIVRGYDRMFIGTLAELEKIVRQAYADDRLVNIAHFSSETKGALPPNPTIEDILYGFWLIGSPSPRA